MPKKQQNKITGLEKWMIETSDMFEYHSDIMFTSRFEDETYYAEANGWGDSKRINVWSKTLEIEKVKESSKMTLDDCAICLSEIKYNKEHSKLVVCGHRFHTKCINKYISTIKKSNGIACCPLCRSGSSDIEIINKKKERIAEQAAAYSSDGYSDYSSS
jgi:hypothetical protein